MPLCKEHGQVYGEGCKCPLCVVADAAKINPATEQNSSVFKTKHVVK